MAELISRSLLFGNPERSSPSLSPDGARIAWLAPRDGVLNLWAAPREDLSAAAPLTADSARGIYHYTWAYTSEHLLYIQDKDGDENWRLFCVHLPTGEVRNLTPQEGVQARIQGLSRHYPSRVLIGLNDRDPQWHDIYSLDIITGSRQLLMENNRFMYILSDYQLRLREAYAQTPEGGIEVYRPAAEDEENGKGQAAAVWQLSETIPPEDALTSGAVGFDDSGRVQYVKDSRGRDTAALFAVDQETGERTLLAEDAKTDAGGALRHPRTGEVQAVSFTYARREWQCLDETLCGHLKRLRQLQRGELGVASRSLDDRYWLTAYAADSSPAVFHLYEPGIRKQRRLFSSHSLLEQCPLVPMHWAEITARDGLKLVLYYSLPEGTDPNGKGIPGSPLPAVLYPHGGPWARDYWGCNPVHQWLANRGYAVISVNFRSSTGFGKSFINAGDREWGGKIVQDQVDAVQWAIGEGIANPQRVGIMGGSFGGYSVLAGLTFYPDLYACGVDIVGPSNLVTLLESMPEYWKPTRELLLSRIGDPRTAEGKILLYNHSPLNYTQRISKPLLIGQGANDPRVKQSESDQIVAVMQEKQLPVTYLLYPNEGHGFARPENRLSFFAVAEAFLAHHLGGRVEPIGNDLASSSVQVVSGGGEVPGLL